MSTAKKILGNTAIQAMGRIGTALTSVILVKTLTDYLGTEGYGQYAAVYELLALFSILADLGLFTIAVREMSKAGADRQHILGNILGMRLLSGAVALLLAILWVYQVDQYEGTWIPIGVLISSLSVFFMLAQGTISSILQVELKMIHSALPQVLGKFLTVAWILAVVYIGYADEPNWAAFAWIMAAAVIGNLFSVIWTFSVVRRYVSVRPRFDWPYWKEILTGSLPYGMALVLGMVYFRIDSTLIPLLRKEDGLEQLGIYSVGMRLLEILSVLPVYFMNSVLPTLTRAIDSSVQEEKRVVQLCFDFILLSVLPMLTGLFVLAYPVVALISAPEFLSDLSVGFYGSDFALQILVFAALFSFFGTLFTFVLISHGKQGQLLWINAFAAFFNVSLNFYAIPAFGFRGSAVVTVATELLVLLLTWWAARRLVSYRLHVHLVWKVGLATALMGGLVYLLKDPSAGLMGSFSILPLTLLGALVYSLVLWALGAFPKDYIRRMLSKAA